MIRKFFMTALAVLLISSLVYAQSGKISGRVVDQESGDALPGANVVIEGTSYGAATNVNGEFVILSVPVGIYSVKASFIGYRNVAFSDLRVNTGLTTKVNFEMPSEALAVSEITIVVERPLVNQNATNAVRIQGYEDIKNLPVRGVLAAIALQPGVVVQNNNVYIRGGRENDVGYYLEGANARDRDGGAASSLGGDSPVQIIPEALEEFQIQAGGYNAEFGGATAGIIRATLKSGQADYHGTLQFETDDFASQGDEFLGTNSYGYRDITATFSGSVPGSNNKLKFFAAGQRILENDRIGRFLNGFDFRHSDTADFANNRFPIILETNRGPLDPETGYSELETTLQQQGLVLNSGNVPNSDREQWIGNGTLIFDAKPLIFRLGGSISWRKQDEVIGNFPGMIFNDRIEQEEVSTALVNLKMTHLISSNSFYEVNVNYFDRREEQYDPIFKDNFWAYWDSTANAAEGIQFSGLNTPWLGNTQPMEIYGFDFEPPGSPIQSDYVKSKRSYFGGSLAFTTQTGAHELKMGVNYERWTARFFNISERTQLVGARNNPDLYRSALNGVAGPGLSVAETQGSWRVIAGNGQRNTYGYDTFGNEIDVDGVDGPRHPKYFSAYVQDKFEASDLVINFGLRIDVIDNDDIEFPSNSDPPFNAQEHALVGEDALKRDADVEISPRLGLAFPVSDRTVFHMQYGRFVQAPRLTDIYNGSTWYDAIFRGGTSFQSNNIGLGLSPEVTTQYEAGFSQQFTDNAAFDVTVFYKSIRDQIQLGRVVVDPTAAARSDYNILLNGDFATTSGVEVALNLRRTNRMAAQINYTFSRALGTGSVPASAISGIELLTETPTIISPLNFHRPQVGSFNIDYRFGRGDGGPILEQLGANLLFTFSSGHPFTLSEGDLGQQDESFGGQITDPRSRRPLEDIGASLTPWIFELNLRVDKTINFGRFDTNFYIYVQNLLNRRNVINVYDRTGNAYNDGFLDNAALSASVIQARESTGVQDNGLDPGVAAAAYTALYNAINLNGNGINYRRDAGDSKLGTELFASPRQIRVGARFEF